MLPQFPLTEQQDPNVLPIQVAPVVDAEPHFPSLLIGAAVDVGADDEVEDVTLGLQRPNLD